MNSKSTAARGDQTRDALILAAIEVFSRHGYNGASTRSISKFANVNQALIGYHFGGKQGLYLAVYEHIASQLQTAMAPVEADVTRQLTALTDAGTMGPKAAVALILKLFDRFIELIGDESRSPWVSLVLREQQEPTEAFHLFYDQFLGRLLSLTTRLVAAAAGLEQESEACRIRAMTVIGQALIFRVARGSTQRHLGWTTLSAANITAFKAQFRCNIEAQFLSEKDLI
jgi:TetR/AcrR family transcriptional regulator, regulator of cefoperazone and chloramphenicol sensitivity